MGSLRLRFDSLLFGCLLLLASSITLTGCGGGGGGGVTATGTNNAAFTPTTAEQIQVNAVVASLDTALRAASTPNFMAKISPTYVDANLQTGFANAAEIQTFLADKFARYNVVQDTTRTFFRLTGITVAADKLNATATAESMITVTDKQTNVEKNSGLVSNTVTLARASEAADWLIVSGIPNRRDI